MLTHDIQNCFPAVPEDIFEAVAGALPAAVNALRNAHKTGELPLLQLPDMVADLKAVQPVAQQLRENFTDILILGTGGSSLGGQTLYNLLMPQYKPTTPRLHFLDNVDPVTFTALFDTLDLTKTALVVISKSGSTAETLMQFFVLFQRMQQVCSASALKSQVVVITEPTDNPLRQFAQTHNCVCFDHDPNIGGRFSVLSIVGLLPAMIAGLDVFAVRQGASVVWKEFLSSAEKSAPAQGAALAVAAAKTGKSQSVLMPYADQLASFGLWYRQLWAESIGKQGGGTTPIRALGTVDQHSQVQLYLDGAKDKLFTVITTTCAGTGDRISPTLVKDPQLSYLVSKTMGDLLHAEQEAMIVTFANNNCPVRVLRLEQVSEHSLGSLLMHFMLETMLAAHLWGVDAFDQPAVEQGKILTRKYLAG